MHGLNVSINTLWSLKFEGGPWTVGVVMYRIVVLLLLALLAGCSATSLRCGVDGDSTYLEIVSVPQDLGPFSRNVASMCGFAYEVEPVASLNIIDSAR